MRTTIHDERNARDRGMTLIELLISISVLGTIVAVLATAVIVTVRQQPETEARLDVARWEQGLALWLPADLSSASAVTDLQTDAPCASAICTFGVNALQLSWDVGAGATVVSYRYGPAGDGTSWQLNRVECIDGSCTSRPILRDLRPPQEDDGTLIPWTQGDTLEAYILDEVIDVTVPLAVSSSDPSVTVDPDDTTAQRVIVNVNGIPGPDGVDRSSSVSFTAGGSTLSQLEPATFSGPTFLQANSGCGGPVTLIVDESGSVSGDIGNIKDAVRDFVKAFDGTPTRLQIIRMDTRTSVLGAGSDWNKFYDLTEPSQVEDLIGPSGDSGLINDISAGGWTNWEDAMNRAFFAPTGQSYEDWGNPDAPPAELVVFFTDGLPTRDRTQSLASGGTSAASVSLPGRYDNTGSWVATSDSFSPRAWYRAEKIVDEFRGDTRMIGVGVGGAFARDTIVERSGWPSYRTWWGGRVYTAVPNEAFLGLLVTGLAEPAKYDAGSPGYFALEYDGGWDDVSGADLLVAADYGQFAEALQTIALDECGGTLTVQTRDSSNNPADASVTYRVGTEEVTTSRVVKSGTFQVDLAGVPSTSVELIPQPLTGTGYTAQSWTCRAGGAELTAGTDFSLISGSAADGINVTVRANAAIACTLSVS